jgi:hypothetical protein
MELLQKISNGDFSIKETGTHAANPGVYNNWTDSIGYWVLKGYDLSDGKIVKAQVKRIVETKQGATIDDKFNNLENDEIKLLAAKEIMFDLDISTIVPSVMNLAEYDQARLRRQEVSAEARTKRWNAMLVNLSTPEVLSNSGKIAFLDETLREYKDDYILSDNKIFEHFIIALDHPLNGVPGFRRFGKLNFASDVTKSLRGSTFWDDVNLGGADADYKNLVADIIEDAIINAKQYISK